jgi:hypothetical protein
MRGTCHALESLRVLDSSVLDEIRKSGFIEKVKG